MRGWVGGGREGLVDTMHPGRAGRRALGRSTAGPRATHAGRGRWRRLLAHLLAGLRVGVLLIVDDVDRVDDHRPPRQLLAGVGQDLLHRRGAASRRRTAKQLLRVLQLRGRGGATTRAGRQSPLACSVMREMTRVTGRPMSAAGWKVSNLMYLQGWWWGLCVVGSGRGSWGGGQRASVLLSSTWFASARQPSQQQAAHGAGRQARQGCGALPATAAPAARWGDAAHQSPVTPSHRPLMRSPVMQPSW